MGVVYKARDQSLDRTVALKMVLHGAHAGEQEHRRFESEAHAAARLSHPGIVQIYQLGEHEGMPYFAMEFCPGGTLADRLRGRPLPPRESAELVEQIARAVQAAHQHGIVHRDLKPGNVMLDAQGSPKVTDFGLARRVEDETRMTLTGAVVGTPSYMAPEQAQGKKDIGPAVDVYSLGAILYECLSGERPFRAESALETLNQVVSAEPVPPRRVNPQVPPDLEAICLKCLQKEPRNRYASAADLADDLHRFLEGAPVASRSRRGWWPFGRRS
jgi:serine/threonine-protein kinase